MATGACLRITSNLDPARLISTVKELAFAGCVNLALKQ